MVTCWSAGELSCIAPDQRPGPAGRQHRHHVAAKLCNALVSCCMPVGRGGPAERQCRRCSKWPVQEYMLQMLWHLRPGLVAAVSTSALDTCSHADKMDAATLTMESDVELECSPHLQAVQTSH